MRAEEREELMKLLNSTAETHAAVARGVAAHGASGDLKVAATSASAASAFGAPERRIFTWEQIPGVRDLKPQRVEWLVDGMVPRGGVTLIAGESGTGKTWLGLLLALGVSKGTTFLGRNCQPADVLYLDRENPESLIYERTQLLGMDTRASTAGILPASHQGRRDRVASPSAGAGDTSTNLKLWGGWAAEPPPLIGDVRLLQLAAERRPLIVVDSLIRFHEQDENSATAMATVMNELRRLAFTGSTVVVLHHKPKGETSQYRGSSDIRAAVDVAFGVRPEADAGLLKFVCFKNRLAPEFALMLRPEIESARDFVVASAPQTQHDRDASDAQRLFELIAASPGLTQSQVIEQSSIAKQRVTDLLHRFDRQLWRLERGPHNRMTFFPLEHAVAGKE
ncbi:MAG: AAA family ATPase [Candidatus Acidiferrales bacterium]